MNINEIINELKLQLEINTFIDKDLDILWKVLGNTMKDCKEIYKNEYSLAYDINEYLSNRPNEIHILDKSKILYNTLKGYKNEIK